MRSRQELRPFVCPWLALLLALAACGKASSPDRFQALRSAVESERQALGVPGVAVAVVEGGKVTFAQGFGSKDPNGKDDVQVFNEIHCVVNKPVLIYLSSKDVIHSLKLVAMRVTQDAIPGLRIPFTFTPTTLGRYQVECAQLCGSAHAAMSGGFILVQTQQEFDAWIKSKSATGSSQSFE